MRLATLVLTLAMLASATSAAWAAVIPDGSKLPPSDSGAPRNLVLHPLPNGHSTPNGFSVAANADAEAAAARKTPGAKPGSGPAGPAGAARGPGAKTPTPGIPAGLPGRPGELDQVSMPGGQPLPWSLIALAVLLFAFSLGGGFYFYRTRDDD